MKTQKDLRIDEIEVLEERCVPGILTITPAGISDGTSNTIASAQPKFGLTMAQQHTGGVVRWTPEL